MEPIRKIKGCEPIATNQHPLIFLALGLRIQFGLLTSAVEWVIHPLIFLAQPIRSNGPVQVEAQYQMLHRLQSTVARTLIFLAADITPLAGNVVCSWGQEEDG